LCFFLTLCLLATRWLALFLTALCVVDGDAGAGAVAVIVVVRTGGGVCVTALSAA
jgi:hypothetical protein